MTDNIRALCIFDEPDLFSEMLEQRLPQVEFSYATDGAGVLGALENGGPDVAFSIKHPDFPARRKHRFSTHPISNGYKSAALVTNSSRTGTKSASC